MEVENINIPNIPEEVLRRILSIEDEALPPGIEIPRMLGVEIISRLEISKPSVEIEMPSVALSKTGIQSNSKSKEIPVEK